MTRDRPALPIRHMHSLSGHFTHHPRQPMKSVRLFCLVLAVASLGNAASAGDVSLKGDNGTWKVHADQYDATVEPDGCMTSLIVNGQEYLRPGVDISRGLYFFQGGALKLPTIEAAANVLTAGSDKASLRYEFGDEKLKIAVANSTAAPMILFVVFDPAVKAVINDKGEKARTPTTAAWSRTTWLQDKSKLQISGSDKLWGPWGGLQVWEADLAPKEIRELLLVPGTPTAEELKSVAALPAPDGAVEPVAEQELTLLSPTEYQVVQRDSAAEGRVRVSGRVKAKCDAVEVHLTGKSASGADLPDRWKPVPLITATHAFNADVAVPAGGWYKLEVRAEQSGSAVAQAAIEHVGVGEVFVGAGQSNSTNFGEAHQTPASGMVASFNGTAWRLAVDPQPGTHDASTGGSFWPAFGDAMHEKYQVPIGVATTGHGGTSVRQWAPGGELFGWTLTRMRQLGPGGFRAVLWHQGESDWGMPADEYAQRLTQIIWASKQAAGWEFPWFVAHASYHGPGGTSNPAIRDGQQQLWDRGIALPGPDTDALGGDNRDGGGNGIHFSAKGLAAHGQAWAAQISPYIDQLLGSNR